MFGINKIFVPYEVFEKEKIYKRNIEDTDKQAM